MATHSSTLAWKIPWTEEAVVHGVTKSRTLTERLHFHFFTFMHWRRKRQPTPVFLPGESQGQGSLVGFRLWGRTESDTTEATQQQQQQQQSIWIKGRKGKRRPHSLFPQISCTSLSASSSQPLASLSHAVSEAHFLLVRLQ